MPRKESPPRQVLQRLRRAPAGEARLGRGGQGKLHADVAHPINTECRNRLQQIILEAYEAERQRAGEPEAPDAAPGVPDAEPSSSEELPTTPLDEEVDWGDALKEDDKKEEGSFGEGVL
jgi:hypothetical protein